MRLEGNRNADQLNVRAKALAALAPNVKPDDASALATEIVAASKGNRDDDQLSALAQALVALAPRVKLEDVLSLATEIVAAIKVKRDARQLENLARALAAVAPHAKPGAVPALTGEIVAVIQESTSTKQFSATLAALAQHLPWPDRLKIFVSVLKFPNVYGESHAVLIEAIKEHPDAGKIKPPGDIWAVVAWLQENHPEIDLTSPPQLPKRVGQ